MTSKTFTHHLRRGLGSAIIELRDNPDRLRYRDIVLRCCLRDISYDTQTEGTKGYYLYTAICALDEREPFEDIIVEAFHRRLSHRIFQQLADIFRQYVFEGSDKAMQAIIDKYECLRKRLPTMRIFPTKYCEREQFEELMIDMVDFNGWSAFKKCVTDAGDIIFARGDDVCSSYDWFLGHSEDVFGKKRVWRYLNATGYNSEYVKAFVDSHKAIEDEREKSGRLRVEPEVTLESLLTRAKELVGDTYAYARMTIASRRFSRQARPQELIALAQIAMDEQDDLLKANLLRVFKYVDFPLGIEDLFLSALSGCDGLQNAAIGALERFKDSRVHDLAIRLMENGHTESALALLKKNWCRQDETIIRNAVLKSKRVSHAMQMELRDIYSNHRSKRCGDILTFVYENGECAFCRMGIIEAMLKNHVISDKLLRECVFDSYDDTRELAKRAIKRRDLS